MNRTRPVYQLPTGRQIYEDPNGTFSHQHPIEMWWCERHRTLQEALQCHAIMTMKDQPPPS